MKSNNTESSISYEMDELKDILGFPEDTASILDFVWSGGSYYQITLDGGFYISPDVPVSILDDIKSSFPEEVVECYISEWESLNEIFRKGIDATQSKYVKFLFIYNNDKSINKSSDVLDNGRFSTSLSLKIFYDFTIFDRERVYEIVKGLPHFSIPVILGFIKKWISFLEEV